MVEPAVPVASTAAAAPSRGGLLSPVLVGRDDLLALAERRWQAARAGTGQLLLFAGEAGIGKSRLLAAIAELAVADSATMVTAVTFPRDAEVAGSVLVDLAMELRRSRDPAAAAAGERMLTNLRVGERGEDIGSPPSADDQTARDHAYRQRRILVGELTDALASLGAAGGPVLIAVEDLHWADELTLEVLDRLARHLPSLAMLVIATYRSDEPAPRAAARRWRARLLTARRAEEATVRRLDPTQTTAMMSAIVGAMLPTAWARSIHQRSDGIPLHIEELLAADRGSHRVADDGPNPAAVPGSLADAVLSRAQLLTPAARELAAAAAVIGRSFDLDLLAEITGEPAERIDAGLRELEASFIVTARPDAGTYDFRHALIRDSLYADLTPLRRRALHGRVARAAVNAGLSDAFISDQYERAREAGPAHRHASWAAATATAMSAHREAVELYRRAQRTGPSDATVPARAQLLARLAAALAAVDENTDAAVAYREAHALYQSVGDHAAAAALVAPLVAVRHLLGADLAERTTALRGALATLDDADLATVDTRVRLLAALSAAFMLDRRLAEALDYGQQARDAAAQRGVADAVAVNIDATVGSVLAFAGPPPEGWRLLESATRRAETAHLEAEAARGYRMMGSSASVLVEYRRAFEWLRQGIEYAERAERWNDRHYMAAHLAHVLWATGDWAAAERQARQVLVDGGDGVTTRITVLHVLGYLALGRREWTVAAAHLDEARGLGTQMQELQRVSPALWGLAETALLTGRFDSAIDWCEQGYAASTAAGDAAYAFPFVVTGVRAYLGRGDPTAASEWLGRVEGLLAARSIPGTLPAVDHAHGLLHLAQGQTGKARLALERASEAWQARRRFWEGTRVIIDLARCAQRSRRPADAEALLAQARQRATDAGATALLNLLGQLAGPSPGTAREPVETSLTGREIEVARWVATGATNRQIAESLHIAPKTVAAHIEHILAKLGVGRRAEIAVWVTARAPTGPPGR